MNFSIRELEAAGFSGFVRVADLKNPGGCILIPDRMGVYVVVREDTDIPAFLAQGTGGFFKGQDPALPLEEMVRKWVSGAQVVYIGKAGGSSSKATLHSRLKQYMDFGCGKPAAHRGGRMIWQLTRCTPVTRGPLCY